MKKIIKQFEIDNLIKQLEKSKHYNESNINISNDLWKYALLIMYTKESGEVTTKDLIKEILKINGLMPEKYKELNSQRKEPYYCQIIRNLKSNKKNKTNFIYRGYCEDIKNGFKITPKGINFVEEYFHHIL